MCGMCGGGGAKQTLSVVHLNPEGRQLPPGRCPGLQRHLCSPRWPWGMLSLQAPLSPGAHFPLAGMSCQLSLLSLVLVFFLVLTVLGCPPYLATEGQSLEIRLTWGTDLVGSLFSLPCDYPVHRPHDQVLIAFRILSSVLNCGCSPGLLVSGSQFCSYLCVTLGRLYNLSVHRDIAGLGSAMW